MCWFQRRRRVEFPGFAPVDLSEGMLLRWFALMDSGDVGRINGSIDPKFNVDLEVLHLGYEADQVRSSNSGENVDVFIDWHSPWAGHVPHNWFRVDFDLAQISSGVATAFLQYEVSFGVTDRRYAEKFNLLREYAAISDSLKYVWKKQSVMLEFAETFANMADQVADQYDVASGAPVRHPEECVRARDAWRDYAHQARHPKLVGNWIGYRLPSGEWLEEP